MPFVQRCIQTRCLEKPQSVRGTLRTLSMALDALQLDGNGLHIEVVSVRLSISCKMIQSNSQAFQSYGLAIL